jgi:hypothetical protein
VSWGGLWGTVWGGTAGAGFSVLAALASANNAVQVLFTEPPLFGSPLRLGDGADLRLFSVKRTDTNADVPLLAVRAVPGDDHALELVIPTRWESPLVTYEVTVSPVLQAVGGDPLVNPETADFAGLPAARAGKQAESMLDLWNPQTLAGDEVLGALVVGTSGDYQLESGDDLLRKLITRRITTALDEFYHLSGKGYGLGIQAKKFYTSSDVVLLRTEVQKQVLLELEVSAARCSVELAASGVMTVRVAATVRRTGAVLIVTATVGG